MISSSTSWLTAQINGVVTYPPWPETAVASARTFQNGSFASEIGRVPLFSNPCLNTELRNGLFLNRTDWIGVSGGPSRRSLLFHSSPLSFLCRLRSRASTSHPATAAQSERSGFEMSRYDARCPKSGLCVPSGHSISISCVVPNGNGDSTSSVKKRKPAVVERDARWFVFVRDRHRMAWHARRRKPRARCSLLERNAGGDG